MGRMSRTKGKVGERQVAKIFRDHGIPCKRGVQHKGGPDSPDIIAPSSLLHCEVKYTEFLSLPKAMSQAEEDCPPGKVPCVIHRKKGDPWKVTLLLDDFLSEFHGNGGNF